MTAQHTPQFIAEMKQQLEQEKAKLEAEVADTAQFPEYGRSDEDNATEIADYQATAATEDALEKRLTEINAALQRIEEDTYGVTNDGELIPEDRLRANPAATTIIKR